MSLEREDFAAFFAAMHDGHEPFAWQERLLDTVLGSGRWPDQVVAPTGSGKTAVIDVHVFALALASAGSASMPPRRLSMVVDRRALVDDQYEYAQTLASRLRFAAAGGDSDVLSVVAGLLWQLCGPIKHRGGDDSPLVVARLRGGSPPSRRWLDSPLAPTVICATPDMWGSRLLFRGYGSSSKAWPREAGLLAVDSVVVVDEAHLAKQLLYTARRVAQLVPVADRTVPWKPLQVVETTATPATRIEVVGGVDSISVGVEEPDLVGATDGDAATLLSARLTKPKPVTLVPVKEWGNTKAAAQIAAHADAVVRLLEETPRTGGRSHTVGCFVNTVAGAIAVSAELRRRQIGGKDLRVVMICGQSRPVDIALLRMRHPGLLTTTGDDTVDVIVSTQSLEVGVDLDFAALVTELAGGPALAQRAGRVNRLGLRPSGPIVVTVPAEIEDVDGRMALPEKTHSGPYGFEELSQALNWLGRLASSPDGLSPWRVRADPPEPAESRRLLHQRVEVADLWHWARTSDDLAAEPDLDLWLAEDFDEETSIGIVVRDMPEVLAEVVSLTAALRPRRHEVFSVPIRTARRVFQDLRQSDELRNESDGKPEARVTDTMVRVRGDDVALLEWQASRDDARGEVPSMRPGDIIVIDSHLKLFTAGGDGDLSPQAVVPLDDGERVVERFTAEDVLDAQPDVLPAGVKVPPGEIVLPIEQTERTKIAFGALAADLTPDGEPLDDDDAVRDVVREWLRGMHSRLRRPKMAAAALDLLDEAAASRKARGLVEVVVHRRESNDVVRVIVLDRRRAQADERLRQEWTPHGRSVTLDDHQGAVAERAAAFGTALHFDDEPGDDLVKALCLAGAHHDDGKCDPRFQVKLGARGDVLLAKSQVGTTAEQRRRNAKRSGLGDWRHEQRSIVECWDAVHESGVVDPQLVLRLVGTSHGHGRAGFPHAGKDLLGEGQQELGAIARRVFDSGEWDEILEATQERYGVFGCAYLEAVLRAADGMVSGEGS